MSKLKFGEEKRAPGLTKKIASTWKWIDSDEGEN
jgi:hypothetical protein